MPLPEEDYISVDRAVELSGRRKVTPKGLRSLIEKKLLPAYVNISSTNLYVKVHDLGWRDGLYYCYTALIDESGHPMNLREVLRYSIDFPYDTIFIKPKEFSEYYSNKSSTNKSNSGEVLGKQTFIPNVTGRQGTLKKMILGGLQAFFAHKQRMPMDGNGFQEFLDFIHSQLKQEPKPDYLAHIIKIEKAGTDASDCVTFQGKKPGERRAKRRGYVSSQFYAFKKQFSPQALQESSSSINSVGSLEESKPSDPGQDHADHAH